MDKDLEKCDCGCHYSDFAYRGGVDCALCGDNHIEDSPSQPLN